MFTSRADAGLDPLVKSPTLGITQWLKEYMHACTLEHMYGVRNTFIRAFPNSNSTQLNCLL